MGSSGPIPVGLLAASGLGHPAVLSTPSLEDFQHSFFSPAFSPAAPQVPLCLDPSSLPCSSCCLAGKSASSFTAGSLGEAQPWLAGVPSWEQDRGLAGSQCDHPLWGAEPHPTCCHLKTRPTTLGTRPHLWPSRPRLSLRGSSLLQAGKQHLQLCVSCLAQLLLMPQQVRDTQGQCPCLL